MKTRTAVALVALAAPVAAQLPAAVAELPQCALTCLGQSLSKTHCSPSDMGCLCSDTPLQDLLTDCVIKGCTIPEALHTKNVTSVACNYPVRDKQHTYVSISNAFGIISGVFVIARLAFKFWAGLDFGLDDLFTLLTILSGVPNSVFNAQVLPKNGIGRDVWTVTPHQVTNFGRTFYIMELIYFTEVALVKLAMLFFYRRIFPARNVRRLLMGTIVFVALYGVAYVFAGAFQCAPVHYYWNKWDGEHHGSCTNINGLAWSNAILSIVLDLWMLAIPLWQLHNLRMDWKKKIGVAIMFGVGTFVTVVSILRLRSLVKFGADSQNPTWEFYDVGMWSTIEINVGIICVSLPTIRLMLVRLFPALRGSTQQHYYDGHYAADSQRASRRFRPTDTGSSSLHKLPPHRDAVGLHQITMHTTYGVEYGDKDEEAGVKYMGDVELSSRRAESPRDDATF